MTAFNRGIFGFPKSRAFSPGVPSLVVLDYVSAVGLSSVDFLAGIDSKYDDYEVHIVGMRPVTDAQIFQMRISFDGGGTFRSLVADYDNALQAYNSAGTARSIIGSASYMALSDVTVGVFNNATVSYSGVIRYRQASIGGVSKLIDVQSTYFEATTGRPSKISGTAYFGANTLPINAFRFLMASGNFAAGDFYLKAHRKV